MDILDDMGVSKLSAKVFFKVNYSFNIQTPCVAFCSSNSYLRGRLKYNTMVQ